MKINENTQIGNTGCKLDQVIPYVLYENNNGTTANITINDSISNYKCIEIYNDLGVLKAFKTGFNTLSNSEYTDVLYHRYCVFNIIDNATSFTITQSYVGNYYLNANHSASFKTYKVVGYK